MNRELGALYVVATPIGNLQDITIRAIETLKMVDCIVAEDTRQSRHLLNHFSIQKTLFSLHKFNEEKRFHTILERLQAGQSIALISDAGTPLISDPGYVTVRALRQHGVRIIPIPGSSALIAALSVAGLPTDSFLFVGFLPNRSSMRKRVFQDWSDQECTLVCYESPHRILSCLEDIRDCLPDRSVVLGRELTKIFETIHAGTASELLSELRSEPEKQRGEFVVLVEGKKEKTKQSDDITISVDELLTGLLGQMSLKHIAKWVSERSTYSKNDLYQKALVLSKQIQNNELE